MPYINSTVFFKTLSFFECNDSLNDILKETMWKKGSIRNFPRQRETMSDSHTAIVDLCARAAGDS